MKLCWQAPQAGAEFQRILDQPGSFPASLISGVGACNQAGRSLCQEIRPGSGLSIRILGGPPISITDGFPVQYMIWDEPNARAKAWHLRCGSRSRHSVIRLTQNE